jgi:hypothetical protein
VTAVNGCRLLIAKPYPGSRIRDGGRRAEVEVRGRREVMSGRLGVCNAWMPALPTQIAGRQDKVSREELCCLSRTRSQSSPRRRLQHLR